MFIFYSYVLNIHLHFMIIIVFYVTHLGRCSNTKEYKMQEKLYHSMVLFI